MKESEYELLKMKTNEKHRHTICETVHFLKQSKDFDTLADIRATSKT